MKKYFVRFFLILGFTALISSCATVSTIEHPYTLNIDLSKYARTADFKKTDDSFTADIDRIKTGNVILVKDDIVNVYCTGSSNAIISELKCELYSNGEKVGETKITNTADKKNFSGKGTIVLKDMVSESLNAKLILQDEAITKKPWIQFKEAKIEVQEKQDPVKPAESSKKTESGETVQKKNKKENSKEAVTDKTTDTSKENEVQKTAKEDSSDKQKNKKQQSKSAEKEEITTVEKTPAASKAPVKNNEPDNESNKKLKTNQTPHNTDSAIITKWYISNTKMKKKVGESISGPFATLEQTIFTWIIKEIPDGKKFCIAKEKEYVSCNPAQDCNDEYLAVLGDIEKYGQEKAYDKYFNFNDIETVKKPEPIVEKETVVEEEIPTPVFDLSNYNKTDYSKKYEKEYLQDYAPKKQYSLPKDKVPEKYIANPNEADSLGCTLLMRAAKNGNNWELSSLLESGADVNLTDKDGWTALMYAVRYQENISIVDALINAGAKIKERNNYNLSALIIASTYNGNPEIIKKLLSYYSVSEKEVLQAFVLLLCDNSSSDFAKIAKIEAFLDKSVPLNTFYKGKTPLMYAAQYSNSTAIIERLLQAGAISSIRSTEGKTAFDFAQNNKKLEHNSVYWSLNRK